LENIHSKTPNHDHDEKVFLPFFIIMLLNSCFYFAFTAFMMK